MPVSTTSALADSVAIVTGGSRGIGLAIAHQLARMGASVVITGRDRQALEHAASAFEAGGEKCRPIASDVGDLASVESFAAQVRDAYRRVDILVNNAGVGGPSAFLHELTPQDWDQIFNTNVRGVYYMVRAIAPLMIAAGFGHIINISSLAGKNALPRGAAYSASKWALNGLTYSLAEELRAHNVRVSLICPGSVDTAFSPRRGGKDPGKMLKPADIAHAVEMLVTQAPQSFISELLIRPTQKP